jgi:hypothetical protein
MKVKIFSISVLLFSIFAFFADDAKAQGNEVKFKFEVDGKPVRQKFKVLLENGGKIIEAKLSKDGFYVPLEFQNCKTCEIFAVRFTSKKYILAFDGVFHKHFDASWRIGIDNKPFDVDNINTSTSYENVKMIHYLSFRPNSEGELATGISVLYLKKKIYRQK